MTAWHVSVRKPDGTLHDAVVEAAADATVGELAEELVGLGLARGTADIAIDGRRVATNLAVGETRIRHGSCLSPADPTFTLPGRVSVPGWYIVAVAGPDTGAFASITSEGVSVGRLSWNALAVRDPALSRVHFQVRLVGGKITVEDQGSQNGTIVEGEAVDGRTCVADGTYIAAGSTTFAVIHVESGEIAPATHEVGPTSPFQRRFRDALPPLPTTLSHPVPPSERSGGSRRSRLSLIASITSPLAMVLMYVTMRNRMGGSGTGSFFDQYGMWLLIGLMAIGPMIFAVDALRRHRAETREDAESEAEYEAKRTSFIAELLQVREEERRRDRWAATPAGIAALLSRLCHSRLWERSQSDEDFCEVAIGLYSCQSRVEIEDRPEDVQLPLDVQWSDVLRHSLVNEGSLAVLGPMDRARSMARALLLDMAASHSPHDVKLWLITDSEGCDTSEWNDLRWLPHNAMDETSNRVFSSPAGRAAAFSLLRSIVKERRSAADERGKRDGTALPVHVVVTDCISVIDAEELTDLLSDGASSGVVGIVLDERVTIEGTSAQLALGEFADEARFVSTSRPRADSVRSFEMAVDSFAPAARSMASLRPAGSARDVRGGAELIRLADLIQAELDTDGIDRVIQKWSTGGEPRVRVGGLGDRITEIDIVRDGPHGLVGGTTRSGKTEFLKTLFTSLATANHPDDLSIVIVDFKGGVDHELSARLPHVIDLSTNHDVASFTRSVSLMEAELERRQREFKSVGAPNFDAYRAAREADASLPPIPRLLVVIDEFSELLSSDSGKEAMSSLESVTRVGGGLGVHLLLVTQNFENQLTPQITANAGLRICFRTQEKSHSKAVLNSPEAASIPKERIGRAFLRSHGGRLVEFQGARVAGPRPGKETSTTPVKARLVSFTELAEAPPAAPIVDVPAEDTDMHAIVQVIRSAAAKSGWTAPAVPWPKELPGNLGISASAGGGMIWPIGLLDEPERQRQTAIGLEEHGPHTLFIGGAEARLGEVARGVVVSGAVKRSPEALHFYVIDQLGQGLSVLQTLPHTGGVAERNEPLAMRVVRHIAMETAKRKTLLSEFGMTTVQELQAATKEKLPDIVLVVHGADRLLMQGESQASPLLTPILSLLAESAGTGVRVLLSGTPRLAFHRVGSMIGHRFVFQCPDPQEYSALGVPRPLHGGLTGLGRAINVTSGHLMQFALVPYAREAPPSEVVRAIGYRLTDRWQSTEGSPLRPALLRELPWPLPLRQIDRSDPPAEVHQPVTMSVDTETGELAWLDAHEDGPAFVVCGPPKSGRSNALIASAALMSKHGWKVLALPMSRRSPISNGAFPGRLVAIKDLESYAEEDAPLALFIDDAHKWTGEVDGLRSLLNGSGDRAVVICGPTEFFNSYRNELLRTLPSRCALVLTPTNRMDAAHFGVRQLKDEVMRDSRPGRGVLVVSGECTGAQVPLAPIL